MAVLSPKEESIIIRKKKVISHNGMRLSAEVE